MGQCPAQTRGRRVDTEPARVIRTEDDADILLTVHGQSVQERTGPRRAIIARLELLTEHDRYRWLNTSFVVGEGEIDEETEEWWIHAFVCVNEVAEHPPGIGQAPPEAFRYSLRRLRAASPVRAGPRRCRTRRR